MDALRLEVRRRSLYLDRRDFVFITEDGKEVLKTTTEGVVKHAERYVNRHLRGSARVHGRAQILQSLRQFNSPKDGYTQFVHVDPKAIEALAQVEGRQRETLLDRTIVQAVQARTPVDLLAVERWAKDHGLWIGLSGKNQALGGKVRLATEGMTSNFPPEKLLARSLLDKPEAFQGDYLRILVVDDPFVDGATGDGAFLLRSTAPRACSRVVHQRVRRSLDYQVQSARRGDVYLRLEFEAKVARYDTDILSVVEDGDVVHIEKRERARIDTGAKLVHEEGFKGTAIVVDRLPEHIESEWPGLDGVCNASCIKSNALLSAHAQPALWGNFQRAFLLRLPVRMLFTGHERLSHQGNRISLNVLSTLNTVSPTVLDRMIEERVDECPGPVVRALLWWAESLGSGGPEVAWNVPVLSKADLKDAWEDGFERRLAFGDRADHPIFDSKWNPEGFVARGRGGNHLLVPSARVLLATLGRVEVEGEPGFHFPDFLNTVLQVVRCLDVRPERFAKAVEQLKENVLRAANAMLDAHSIRVPGLHGVLVAVKGLGKTVVVPNGTQAFQGSIHGEPTMNRDGIREAVVLPLSRARAEATVSAEARYLLDHLVPEEFAAVFADFDRLTRMNRDNDGDLIYVSRLGGAGLEGLDAAAEAVTPFVVPSERMKELSESFSELQADHDPIDLAPEVVHRAVIETAGSARDVGSITLWKYVAQEALAEEEVWHLFAPLARIVQAYIDGMKGPHQTSANLFVALMRVWARMSVPCVAEKDPKGRVLAVKLAGNLERELRRAGFVEGTDYFARVEVPHPALADEAYRKIKRPLVEVLEEILGGIERQQFASRRELQQMRDVLERAYGVYPSKASEKDDDVVAERRRRYTAVQRLYGIRPVSSVAEVEAVGVTPLWNRLMSLSAGSEGGRERLDALAEQAVKYGQAVEHVEF